MNIPINDKAPVKAKFKIGINAPVETVWRVLTSVNDWPGWQKAVTKVRLNSNLEEGAHFDWSAGGLKFKSVIHTIKTPSSFGWTGKTLGTSAIHNWTLLKQRKQTVVTVEESLQGLLPSLLRNYFQKTLENGMKKSLEELKLAAESSNDQ